MVTSETEATTMSFVGRSAGLLSALPRNAPAEPFTANIVNDSELQGGGAACQTRTDDPIITNDVLYQLS